MSKINQVMSIVSRATGRGGLLLRKHSPEILLVTGVVGIITSTVMACKSTLKVEEIMADSKDKVAKIKEVKADLNVVDYSEQDYKKDLTIAYTQRGVELVKLYGPAVSVGVASIGCILGAHNIMQKRNLALIAAYKAVEQSFADYRKRVVDEFGEEKNRQFKTGVHTEVVSEKDENGKKSKKVIEVQDPNGFSQYAKFFDEASSQWSKTPEYNMTFLKCQQNYANDLLHSRGHVFLNEVYDMLGIPRTKAGAIVGWVKGEGDDFIDFGIFNAEREKVRDFVNGYERSILLDFNVTGVIYDMI